MDCPSFSIKENLKLAGFRSHTEGWWHNLFMRLRLQLFYQQRLLVVRETAAHRMLTQEQNSSKLESSGTAYLHNKDAHAL